VVQADLTTTQLIRPRALRGPLAAEETRRVIDEWLDRVRDLAGVAKVVVEDQWYERHWRAGSWLVTIGVGDGS
jgi:hypothetical protein